MTYFLASAAVSLAFLILFVMAFKNSERANEDNEPEYKKIWAHFSILHALFFMMSLFGTIVRLIQL